VSRQKQSKTNAARPRQAARRECCSLHHHRRDPPAKTLQPQMVTSSGEMRPDTAETHHQNHRHKPRPLTESHRARRQIANRFEHLTTCPPVLRVAFAKHALRFLLCHASGWRYSQTQACSVTQ